MSVDRKNPRLTRSYAGIGSRSTPEGVVELLSRAAEFLAGRGWVLRTGAARGADQAFMAGASSVDGEIEVYLADGGYRGFEDLTPGGPSEAAFELAAKTHPAWDRCSPRAKALHARNGHQVLGRALDDPVRFVICWTPDGSLDGSSRESGGTGQALRIASERGIPVLNTARQDHRERVEAALRGDHR
jgi:hypothetical protein